MKRRIAVLDLGTNTFHLLIADTVNSRIDQQLIAEKRDVKLGEGGITNGIIAEAAFKRGIEALRSFQSIINEYNPDEVHAVGTAALRSASNARDFIEQVKEETGITIEIVDGGREAELIYKGVRRAIDLSESGLIADIGGGSVEFIFCDKHEVVHKKSYPIGAARLMDLFHHSDPISETDILAIHQYLDEQLNDLKINAHIFKPQLLIGSAGAFETFVALAIDKFNDHNVSYDGTSFFFQNGQFHSVINDILKSTHAEREANGAIIPVRVDMIVVAAVLTSYIVYELHIPEIAMSAYSLREGLLFDQIEG